MAEPPRTPDTDEDAAMPMWVYAIGAVAIVAALAFVVMHLAGGGFPGH